MDIEESNDVEFENEIIKIGKFSKWFVLINMLMMLPQFSYILSRAATLRIGDKFKVRCAIPEIENSDFSFDEIQTISQPTNKYNKNCTYFNYDYMKIADSNYPQALEYMKQQPIPKLERCYEFVFDRTSKYSTMYKDFTLFCYKGLENGLLISNVYGCLLGNLFIVPFADLLGRKRILNWGVSIIMASGMIMNLSLTLEVFLCAKFMSGIGYACVKKTIEAIVIELSTPLHRGYRYLLIHAGSSGYAFLLLPLLSKVFLNWRFLQWATSISLLFLPLATWYIPESPRWLHAKKQKGKAWTILKNIKNAEGLNESLMMFRNERGNFCNNIEWHLKNFRSIYNPTFWVTLLLISITGSTYCKNYAENFQQNLSLERSMYLIYLRGVSEFISLSISIPLAYIVGKKVGLLVLTLSTFAVCITIAQIDTETWQGILVYFMLEIITSASMSIAELHGAENVPTTHRCTALAFHGVGSSLFIIILFHTLCQINIISFFYVLGGLSAGGFIISWFVYKDMTDKISDTYDQMKTFRIFQET